MAFTSPAFVPKIADLLQGTNYDMVVSERVRHANQITEHPLEDPDNSSLVDHVREELLELSLSIVVSTDVIGAGLVKNQTAREKLERPVKFMDELLKLKRLHTISTKTWITVFTGFKRYDNLAITELSFSREQDQPNTFEIEMTLREMRVVGAPRSTEEFYPMEAMRGDTSVRGGGDLTSRSDRFITQKTFVNPRADSQLFVTDKPVFNAITRGRLRTLGTALKTLLQASASLDVSGVSRLGYAKLETFPSYTKWVDERFQLNWSFNQTVGKWSVSVTDSDDKIVVGGRLVVEGFDLFDGVVGAPYKLVPVFRASNARGSQYDGFTRELDDGLSAMFLVSGTAADFTALLKD